MSDYRVFNDNGYERTWEELYEDNVRFQKYTDKLEKENKQLKEQLLVTQTNEETFRLEMEDITRALGLAEDTLFDDVKTYARSLKDNWNKLKDYIVKEYYMYLPLEASTRSITILIDKMQELEQGSDSNE